MTSSFTFDFLRKEVSGTIRSQDFLLAITFEKIVDIVPGFTLEQRQTLGSLTLKEIISTDEVRMYLVNILMSGDPLKVSIHHERLVEYINYEILKVRDDDLPYTIIENNEIVGQVSTIEEAIV